ncbi:MAG TPA: DinB family protein [Thermoanaerobaculia bacterium]|nr:DinB family protein [Thermoanaerobaculia bacterium]
MSISETLLPELDHEMATTRRMLERVPIAEKGDWKPHEKSMSLSRLANHVAELPGWLTVTVTSEALDLANYSSPTHATSEALLASFDALVTEGRAALAAASDEDLFVPWALQMGGQELFKIPRVAVLRTWVFNHIVHHRGQLTVYLRELGVPVPSIYGPSADES